MIEFFANLFNTEGFPARWYCGVWTSGHGWLHILSDLATFAAYMAIPCVMVYFLRRRRNTPFPRIFFLFAAFIFSCGAVHLVEASIFWWPAYRLSGLLKLITATVSWCTVVAFVFATPRMIAMRSPEVLEYEMEERKRAELELLESEERYRSLFDSISDMVQSVRPDGRFLFVNPAWLNALGYSGDDLRELTLFDVVHPDHHENFKQALITVAGRDDVAAFEVDFLKKDGDTIPVEGNLKGRFVDDELISTHGFFRDISERKATEAMQAQLLQSERLSAIGEAMAGLVHESRNALARSQAGLKLLSRQIKDRPELDRYVAESLKAQKDVQNLFEEVRFYAVPPKIKRQMTDIPDIVEEVWQNLTVTFGERNATITQHRDNADVRCMVDRFSLGNVFRNLIEKSMAACSDPVAMEVSYGDTQLHDRDALAITFRDNGPGFTEEDATKAFAAFFTTRTHGSGLGLSISRRSVEQHDGTIALNSSETGAEFVIILPRKEA